MAGVAKLAVGLKGCSFPYGSGSIWESTAAKVKANFFSIYSLLMSKSHVTIYPNPNIPFCDPVSSDMMKMTLTCDWSLSTDLHLLLGETKSFLESGRHSLIMK